MKAMTLCLACAVLLLVMDDLLVNLDPPQQLPLVKADYSRCVTVQTGPIEPTREPTNYHVRYGRVA